MKTLLVDCGATKTDWLLTGGKRVRTPGFNLAQTPPEVLKPILDDAASRLGGEIGEIHFYAAGLVGESPVDLGQWFPSASIEYASDMLGAARAVCGHAPGNAAILGTGANTCQFDGEKMVRQVRCGGFILGDEGAGSVLGKLFIADFLKGFVPRAMADDFASRFPSDYPSIVKSVYASPAPARYLGSFAPFVLSYYEKEEYARTLVERNFRNFFRRTVIQYDALPLGVVGGFGYACASILRRIGEEEFGICFSSILESPLDGLIHYHGL